MDKSMYFNDITNLVKMESGKITLNRKANEWCETDIIFSNTYSKIPLVCLLSNDNNNAPISLRIGYITTTGAVAYAYSGTTSTEVRYQVIGV